MWSAPVGGKLIYFRKSRLSRKSSQSLRINVPDRLITRGQLKIWGRPRKCGRLQRIEISPLPRELIHLRVTFRAQLHYVSLPLSLSFPLPFPSLSLGTTVWKKKPRMRRTPRLPRALFRWPTLHLCSSSLARCVRMRVWSCRRGHSTRTKCEWGVRDRPEKLSRRCIAQIMKLALFGHRETSPRFTYFAVFAISRL